MHLPFGVAVNKAWAGEAPDAKTEEEGQEGGPDTRHRMEDVEEAELCSESASDYRPKVEDKAEEEVQYPGEAASSAARSEHSLIRGLLRLQHASQDYRNAACAERRSTLAVCDDSTHNVAKRQSMDTRELLGPLATRVTSS